MRLIDREPLKDWLTQKRYIVCDYLCLHSPSRISVKWNDRERELLFLLLYVELGQ